MLARRILSWAFLGSLVFAVPRNRTTKTALDGRKVSIYNGDMEILFQGTQRELIANSRPQVELALVPKDMCWNAEPLIWPFIIKTFKTNTGSRKQDALLCLNGLRHGMSHDCSIKDVKVSSNKCRCGVHLGPDADNKGALDESGLSGGNLFSRLERMIEADSFDGTFTAEWALATRHLVGFVVDCRGDWSGVDNSLARWKAGQFVENEDSSKTHPSAIYFVRP
jgi:hypothetical protein